MNTVFAENLKKIRKENHLSQEQLAEELGVSRQAISKWESALAYPEMDKIVAICEKFHVNIDDLLHHDILEIKGEEETKKNLNQYVDDFLNFITNTISLLSRMSFKSKCKWLIEQCFLCFLLFLVSSALWYFGTSFFKNILYFLPHGVFLFVFSLFRSLLLLFLLVFSIIILIHIFKVRYLDYYENYKKGENKKTDEVPLKDEKPRKLDWSFEQPIIIRDPKHSEYRFIQGLFKMIIVGIKFFALVVCFGLCMSLVGCFTFFILSFMVIQSGLFFFGWLGASLCLGILNFIVLLLFFNFVFDRKSDKKKMIWSFLITVCLLGISIGFLLVGFLHFDIVRSLDSFPKVESIRIPMSPNLSYQMQKDATYIEEDISDIRIEYETSLECSVKPRMIYEHIYLDTSCDNSLLIAREFLQSLNQKKILDVTSEIRNVKIYASFENLDLLQRNREISR